MANILATLFSKHIYIYIYYWEEDQIYLSDPAYRDCSTVSRKSGAVTFCKVVELAQGWSDTTGLSCFAPLGLMNWLKVSPPWPRLKYSI